MIRAILCRIGAKPRTIYLGRNDGHMAVMKQELRCRGSVVLLSLVDGVELCCDRNGLLLGLGLARRTMAAALRAMTDLRREPPPSETRPGDGHDWDLDVDLGNWPASGGFALVLQGTPNDEIRSGVNDGHRGGAAVKRRFRSSRVARIADCYQASPMLPSEGDVVVVVGPVGVIVRQMGGHDVPMCVECGEEVVALADEVTRSRDLG